MLKGSIDLPFTFFISIMAVALIFFVGVMFLKSAGDSAKVTTTTMGYINTADAAHFVENCLSEGKDYILAIDLDAKSGDIGEVCKDMFPSLSRISATAKVIDLESKRSDKGKVWSFGWSEGSTDPSHQIYVNIMYDNEIHIGRLYVQTKS